MKVGRNDPCPCGSGKKYKKCCINNNIIPFSGNPEVKGTRGYGMVTAIPPGSGKEYGGGVDPQAMMLETMDFKSSKEMDAAMKKWSDFCTKAEKTGKSIPSFMEFMGRGNALGGLVSPLSADMKGRVFESKEEVEGYVRAQMDQENQRPVNDFQGLE